jgi:hypothetical protein
MFEDLEDREKGREWTWKPSGRNERWDEFSSVFVGPSGHAT